MDRLVPMMVWLIAGGMLAAWGVCAGPLEAGSVLQVLRDFENERADEKRPAIVFWNWTAEQKAQAADYSSVEVTDGTPFGQQCLKLSVSDGLPKGPPGYRMVPLGVDYLPPQADAVRMKLKVLRGKLTLTVGGPTVYFGHSDVLARAVQVDAATQGDWSTVEFSLNEGLTRNFRRSEWAHDSPVIYYSRWVQEPMAIEIAAGSAGEVLIDQVELISYGQGKPYPTFDSGQALKIATAANFEDANSMNQTFTILTSVAQQPKLEGEPQLVRKSWAPPHLRRVAEAQGQGHSLEAVMTGTEEVCFAGIKLTGVTDANAIALKMKAEHAAASRPGAVVDFVAYTAKPEQRRAFPWDALRPPVSWRDRPEIAFTYYLTPKNEALKTASFGMYHARRLVPNGEWSTVVIPLADFVCLYGQGEKKEALRKQLPLAGQDVFALTFLSYYGQRSTPTRMLIDEVSFVKVPGSADELRSFYQAQALSDDATGR